MFWETLHNLFAIVETAYYRRPLHFTLRGEIAETVRDAAEACGVTPREFMAGAVVLTHAARAALEQEKLRALLVPIAVAVASAVQASPEKSADAQADKASPEKSADEQAPEA